MNPAKATWWECIWSRRTSPSSSHRQPYQYQPIPTIISLFFNVVFILFVVSLLNRKLIKFAPGAVLTQGELITLYIMLSLLDIHSQRLFADDMQSRFQGSHHWRLGFLKPSTCYALSSKY